MGDVNGISLEVILKTIAPKELLKICTPVLYGSSKVVSYHRNIIALDEFEFQGSRTADRLNPDVHRTRFVASATDSFRSG